ncbi:hypothetical protein ANCDUO_10949 [Ancylostoma duodenale]|uniref:Chitin-binding type-2 domain-containing protein n=1 Tax=Ancylostoma duodenale TaxID=51022 RepID=A0A0C2D9E3_9BILA|nr:hypothetical protein ANCDUO_10949 [Ancylostoma duodenale]
MSIIPCVQRKEGLLRLSRELYAWTSSPSTSSFCCATTGSDCCATTTSTSHATSGSCCSSTDSDTCPSSLVFNEKKGYCDYPENCSAAAPPQAAPPQPAPPVYAPPAPSYAF